MWNLQWRKVGVLPVKIYSLLNSRETADEEDAFESDFESTDEEAMQEDVDAAAEKVIREEERKNRKVR